MIHFETAMHALDRAGIKSLDFSMFAEADLVNVILQRSRILSDQPFPGRVISAWEAGDDGPAREVIDRLGYDLVRRATAYILLEYEHLKPILSEIAPRLVADIGCGYGFFDFFLHHDFDFPPIGDKPPAFSRSASAKLSMIFSPEF